ncbi:uncharacterized protein GLRG_03421 [Colletotrichum graminicola M1.001]|uniref:Uncharacterized protein n=1 Tax=Colletotrichum graminicola (strain M1.001 / M2 / FGSC 10212) TaxID=645133 RepID=E3QBD8_COLGM|nr:uncharacterized protein GLRG_03421 [Colletotrichum graminicola M1.001]EFQ28277.1 hypothetical protein GLRG_03421 [Colletotrichum graminicola M1.001]
MSPARGALVPRFLIDAPKLAVRDGGICVDIGFPETCCANTNYCYVKPDNRPWCCPVGSNCDSNCAATAYQCPATVTRTVSETVMGGGGAVVTTSVSSACCGRTCPSTSAFRCESQFGGGCCSYGQTCVSGGGCVRAVTPTTSATVLLTPVDPGCTATAQHACADGGCCDRLWDCVVVSGTAACAPGRPTTTDVRIVDEASDGLSTGAKAGIGVGVSVVGCALVMLSAWFCLFRRRRRGSATASSRRSGGGGGGTSRVSGGVSGIDSGGGSERPGRSARAMSEVASSSPPTMWRGGTQEYFGPDAVAGPYTETETTTPGRGRGVPLQAHLPSDVVAPVEMDSVGVVAEAEAEVKAAQERYELYGCEVASPPAGSIAGVSMMDRSSGPRVRGGHSA